MAYSSIKHNALLTIITIAAVSLLACKGNGSKANSGTADTVEFKYATNIRIENGKGYATVSLTDPWNEGKTLHKYILVPADSNIPSSKLPKGTIVKTPLKKAVVATSVHCGLAISLHRGESIAGVCDLQYIDIPYINERCKSGKITDCGSGIHPSIEKIIDTNADALFLSPFQNSGGYGRAESLGIPIIECADYMETSALGRAEWMKFYGMLFGAENEADSIFKEVESNYMHWKEVAATSSTHPEVLFDRQIGSVWYVPGGNSTIGRLAYDANASYAWSDDMSSGSLPLPFERVLEKASECDVWLIRYNSPYALSYDELLLDNKGYKQFKALRNKNVYGCNTATSKFYEETPFRPDRLLHDITVILHPDVCKGEPTTYFKPVK